MNFLFPTAKPTEGIANFEKCVSRLEQVLPNAIAHRNRSRNDDNEGHQHANDGDDDDDEAQQQLIQQGKQDIAVVQALIKCVEENFVDDGCNAPPNSLAQVPGLTAAEAMSREYRRLTQDFAKTRDRWQKPGKSGSRGSSRASSTASRTSSNARKNRIQPRFGSGGSSPVPQGTASLQLKQDQEQLPPSTAFQPHHSTQDIAEIGHQVRSVRELQDSLSSMVDEQQPKLNTAEANVDKTLGHTERGRKNLLEAMKMTTLGSGLAGGIVGALVAGPAGFVLGAQSAAAIAMSMAGGGAVGAFTGTKLTQAGIASSERAEENRVQEQRQQEQQQQQQPSAAAAASTGEVDDGGDETTSLKNNSS